MQRVWYLPEEHDPVRRQQATEELAEIVQLAEAPFIVKGGMTVNGALEGRAGGAAAIVVSKPAVVCWISAPATAEVLPEIAAALRAPAKVLVDGGIRTGVDAVLRWRAWRRRRFDAAPLTAVYGGAQSAQRYIDKWRGTGRHHARCAVPYAGREITRIWCGLSVLL